MSYETCDGAFKIKMYARNTIDFLFNPTKLSMTQLWWLSGLMRGSMGMAPPVIGSSLHLGS